MPESEQSIGRKILSFFVKDEPSATGMSATGTSTTGTSATGTPPRGAAPTPRPAAAVSAPATGGIDSRFAEHLADVLAKNNPPGPDYFEFRETLRSLNNLGLTEDKQFQAAWASFKALGGPTDVNALTGTAKQYLTALASDREAFNKSADAALSERVGGLQNEQQRLQAENESLARQLLEIQKRIDTNATRLSAIGGEITEQSTKLNQNRQNYEQTFTHFTEQIKSDIDKIAQYLK